MNNTVEPESDKKKEAWAPVVVPNAKKMLTDDIFKGFEKHSRKINTAELHDGASAGNSTLGKVRTMRWYSPDVHALSRDGEQSTCIFLDKKHYNKEMLLRLRRELEFFAKVKPHDHAETLLGVAWDKPGQLIIVLSRRGPETLDEVLHGSSEHRQKYQSWKDGLIDFVIHITRALAHLHDQSICILTCGRTIFLLITTK